MVVRFWIIIVPLHSTGKGCISMDTTADKTLSVASVPETQGMEQNIKDRKDGLHPAVHIQGVEREKEYVVGNHLQD